MRVTASSCLSAPGRASPPLPENYFGEEIAAVYDEETADMPVEPVVDFLVELARGGPVLELAIGTGRIALPLAQRGLRVHGIDLSEAMVAKLRDKPGGDEIDVTIGDYATTRVDGKFRLAYLVFNGIQNQTTQDAQVASFENVAAHLEPGGCFVVEVVLPDLKGEKLRIFDFGDSHIGIDEYDFESQGLISHHYTKRDGGFHYSWGPFRYVWPSELDLMARIAGLTPRERYSGWKREPFTAESTKIVAVYALLNEADVRS
jgi:SAM-dependent methyltransferase